MLISVMSGNHDIPTFKNNCVFSMALTWAALTRFLYCVLTVVDKSSYFGPLKKKKKKGPNLSPALTALLAVLNPVALQVS